MLRIAKSQISCCRGKLHSKRCQSVWSSMFASSKATNARQLSTVAGVNDSFLSGANSAYIEEMYSNWLVDPNSVHKSWDVYFRTGSYQAPPTLVADYVGSAAAAKTAAAPRVVTVAHDPHSLDAGKVVQMVRAFQVRGHLIANLDPLGLMPPRPNHEELTLSSYGFSDADLDKTVDLGLLSSDVKGFLDAAHGKVTLREIYNRCKELYCGSIGFEYMHIHSVEQCNWLREKIETKAQWNMTEKQKVKILDRLTWADHFEQFLAKKFTSAKRFGLEGGEALIPGMKAMIGRSADLGVDAMVMGMPHRGRLNVLGNVVRKPFEQILCEFEGVEVEGEFSASGDVKYHLGASHDRLSGTCKKLLHCTLLANPSHLEAVNPVVVGKTRAKQFYMKDHDRSRVMGVLLHGDAAFAGQGIVYETMNMSQLNGYTTGGTIHIVVNNQVGFTTDPQFSRSTTYNSDIGKTFDIPIFHVNGDDPEAVVFVHELAAEWRAQWKKDVIIDIVCFRKFGHNEIDEPAFTQPHMYQIIRNRPSVLQKYQAKLLAEGVDKKVFDEISSKVNNFLEGSYEKAKTYKPKASDWLGTGTQWAGFKTPSQLSPPRSTGVEVESLREIGLKTTQLPEDFSLHSRIKMVFDKKVEAVKAGKGIDWGTAEALAFGSLLTEGRHVRITGQDVQRGTFSHRHAVVTDQKIAGRKYCPLNHLSADQAELSIHNSHLSEFGVLGFEYGYSVEHPNQLVLWEGQFGDFFNGAQVMVDQFISSGEEKWYRQSGLVMLLPHGYEGQGPEHSSARLERFLQMSNDHPEQIPDPNFQIQRSNWQIVNATTPANYFHLLRRQLYRDFRKPLIVMSPKSLLRHPMATSTLEDMAPGTFFQSVLPEDDAKVIAKGEKVRRHLFCSGKVYYDLIKARQDKKIDDVAITRVEQISPFPFHKVAAEAARFPNAEVMWVQEEPLNMGSYFYTKPRLESALKQLNNRSVTVTYSGRNPSGSTATGYHHIHDKELHSMLDAAFAL